MADALSRKPDSPAPLICLAVSEVQTSWDAKIQQSVLTDGKCQALIDVLKDGTYEGNKYQWSQGMLTRKGKRVVGNDK